MTDVTVAKVNGQYALHVKKGEQQADIPIPECKSDEEANAIKDALIQQIANVEQKATTSQGVGEKLDKVA